MLFLAGVEYIYHCLAVLVCDMCNQEFISAEGVAQSCGAYELLVQQSYVY